MNFLNNVSRQSWGVIFVLVGAALSCNDHTRTSGTILLGGGLAILEIKLPSVGGK